MQDRRRQFDEIFLQRTAGPYIWVNRVTLTEDRRLPIFRRERTSSRPVGMSQTCRKPNLREWRHLAQSGHSLVWESEAKADEGDLTRHLIPDFNDPICTGRSE